MNTVSFLRSRVSLLLVVSPLLFGGLPLMGQGPEHGCIEHTCDTNLPTPASDSDAGVLYRWTTNWSIAGSKGSFMASAETWSSYLPFTGYPNLTTGLHTGTGCQQDRIGNWDGGSMSCSEPDDARITGQANGTVGCSIHIDANNDDFGSTGSGAAHAKAELNFTGIAAAQTEIDLNASFSEGDTDITAIGHFGADPTLDVTITTTVGADVADAQGSDTISVTKQFEGTIGGKVQEGVGTVTVLARSNIGAREATAEANTSITKCSLTGDSGGTTMCGDAVEDVDAPVRCEE